MKKIILIFSLFLIANIFILAEESKKVDSTTDKNIDLDIKTAIDLGLKNNLNIESENLTLEKKKWAAITSWNTFIPSMSLGIKFSRANNRDSTTYTALKAVGPSSGGVYDSVYEYSYDTTPKELGLAFDFTLSSSINAKMFFSIYSTVLDYKNGKISMDTAKKQLSRDIKKDYYNLLLLKETIKLYEDNLEALKKTYEQALVDYKYGLKTEYDLLSAQVSYETLKPDLLSAQNNYDNALISYKHVIGLKDEVQINFIEKIETFTKDLDSNDLINKYLDKRLDLQSLNATRQSLTNTRNIYISALTPSFTFTYYTAPTFQYDLTKSDTWSNDSSTNWKDTSGYISFGFSVPIGSYVPFSSDQMNIVNNEIALKQQNIAIKKAELSAKEEIIKSVSTLNKSTKSQENLKLSVNLAQKAYNLAQIAYKAGTKDILNLQDSKNKLEKAKLSLLQEEITYITTFIDLEYQVNNELK
jgi:outer membrane protein TolC